MVLLTFLSLLLTFNCISETPGNYFDRVAMVSDGRLTRFTKLPITVYVEGLTVQGKDYAADLQYAMKEWRNSSGGLVKFQLIDLPNDANILVSWVRALESEDQEHPLGVSELQRTGQDEFRVEMRIGLQDKKSRKPLTHEQMKTVFLHEFGHAIGLWGHSKDKADVMYYAADATVLTSRDLDTLKMVYSHKLGYSLHAESISAIRKEMRTKLEDPRLYFLLGTIYADQEDFDQAIDNFKICLHIDPEFYKASSALASAYRGSGQEQAALAEYLSLAESKPSAMVHNIVGALYYEKEDTAKAIQHFKQALKLERTYPPAKRNLSKVYIARGKELINAGAHQAAIELLLDGVEFFPDKPELYNSLGSAYAGAKQFQEAIDVYTKALSINPAFTLARVNIASSYNNQGVKYAEAGLWNKAVGSYNQALRLMPDMAEAEKNLSAAYWNQASSSSKAGQNKESVIAYKRFLEREPDSKEAYNNIGAVYFRMGDYQAAVDAFRNALKIDPADVGFKENLAIAHHKQGIDLIEKGDIAEAITTLKSGLKVAPDNVSIHLSMAQAYQRLGKWDETTKYINKALELEPDSDAALNMMAALNIHRGNEYLQAERYDQALEYYGYIPDDRMPPALHNNIGYIYIMGKRHLEAIEEFDKVLAAEPQNKIAHQNLLTVEGRLGRTLSGSPGSQQIRDTLARARLSLAMSHAGRGSIAEAKKVLKSALDVNPQDRDLRRLLAAGCRKLAAVFGKDRSRRKEAMQLTTWAAQLESR
ncbi:tetratricopeptide repeat protein [Candidatus Poribacteria bacterium]